MILWELINEDLLKKDLILSRFVKNILNQILKNTLFIFIKIKRKKQLIYNI